MALDFPNTPTTNQVFDNWIWDSTKWPTNPATVGTVVSVTAGNGLTGGVITTNGTIALAVPVVVGNGGTGQTSFPSVSSGTLYATDAILGAPGGTTPLQAASISSGYVAVIGPNAPYTQLAIVSTATIGPNLTLAGTTSGTPTAPAGTVSGNILGDIDFRGYESTNNWVAGSSIVGSATENWTPTTHGSQIVFNTTTNGSTALSPTLALMPNHSVEVFGNTLYLAGSYAGIPASPGGGSPGPFIYGDSTAMVFRLGAGSGAHYWFEDANPSVLAILDGNLTLSSNYVAFAGATPAGINGVGGPYMYGDASMVVAKLGGLTSPGAFIVQAHNGVNLFQFMLNDPGPSTTTDMFSQFRWRFRQAPGDESSAGSIDYRGYDASALSIVGAGTSTSNRNVHIYDNLFTSNLTISGTLSVANLTASGTIQANYLYSTGIIHADGGITSNGTMSAVGGFSTVNGISANGSISCSYFFDSSNATINGTLVVGNEVQALYVATNGQDSNGYGLAVDGGNLYCAYQGMFGGTLTAATLVSNGDTVVNLDLEVVRNQVVDTGYIQILNNPCYATGFVTISDERLKENVYPLEPQIMLDVIEQLRPVKFNYIGQDRMQTHYGFIAQEAKKALLSNTTVVTSPASKDFPDGKLGIDFGQIQAVLVASVQELAARVAKLEGVSKP